MLRGNFVTLSETGTRRQGEAVSVDSCRNGNKVALEVCQRLANVIACKNVIKDQRTSARRILRAETDELNEITYFQVVNFFSISRLFAQILSKSQLNKRYNFITFFLSKYSLGIILYINIKRFISHGYLKVIKIQS